MIVDWRARKTSQFTPDRDLPGCFAWYDTSKLTGGNGASIDRMGDESGSGFALGSVGTARPTLIAGGLNGLNTLRFTTIQQMISSAGATAWDSPTRAQPITIVALVKFRAAGNANFARVVMSSTGGSGVAMAIAATVASSSGFDSWPYASAGSATPIGGGAGLNDDQWHVVIVKMNVNAPTIMVDGRVTGAPTTAVHGSNAFSGQVLLGAYNTSGTFPMDGDFAEGGYIAGDLSLKQCEKVTEYLRAKWNYGPTSTPKQDTVISRDFTDANGQAYRMFHTTTLSSATPPLVILNHAQAGNSLVRPGLVGYTAPVRVAAEAGYVVVVPNNHGGDSWSSPSAVADGPAAETAAALVLGISGFSRIVLVGTSMGGMLAAVQAKLAAFTAPLKGMYFIDGGFNLKYGYNSTVYRASYDIGFAIVTGTITASLAGATSLTSTVSIPSGTAIVVDPTGANPEYVTTTGAPSGAGPFTIPVPALAFAHANGSIIADQPSKTVGRDPCAWVAADIPSGKRWRFVAGPNDPTADKTRNTDAFRTILGTVAPANITENTIVTHSGGHLEISAFRPDDFIAFADRCV